MEEENCKSLLGALSDYIEGTAQEELCREIERHLAGCDNCRIVVDTLKKTVYLYQSSTDISLPQAVRERLFKRLNMDEFLKAN
jgi:hypothetical protein